VSGGGQPYASTDDIRAQRIAGMYNDDERSTIRCSHQNPEIKQIYEEYLGEPLSKKSHHLLHTTYTERPIYKR